LSYSDNFPEYYKIAGVSVFLDFDLHSTSRSLYSLFDFFGDLGGLNEILFLIGVYITSYWTKAGAYRYAWHSLYYMRKNNERKKLPLTREKILLSNGIQDYDPEVLNTLKDHMKKSFQER
jgi:hypothetical protein